jgi:uncharacterized membrane protein YkvA (DUF1232 family)
VNKKLEKPPLIGGLVGEVARVIPRIPKYGKLTWLLLKDAKLSAKQKTALIAAVGYSISPIDAIPGFIPVIGQLDDLAVVLYTVRWILSSMPTHEAESFLSKAGLTTEILEDDFQLVRRNSAKVLKKMLALMGWTAVTIWSAGRFASREIGRQLRKRRSSARCTADNTEEADIG